MKAFFLSILILCAAIGLKAQQRIGSKVIDSITEAQTDQAALMYPRLRQFSITHQQGLPGKITAKGFGQDLFKGKLQSARTTINFNVPVYERKKSSVVTSVGVVHQFFGLKDIVSSSNTYAVSDSNSYIPMLSLGMTYIHRDSIFGRPVSLSATVSGLFNPSFSRHQLSFTGLVTTPIIKRENTRLMGGLVINLDPSSPVPGFIFVNYFHKFKSANLDLMVDIPFRVALRKPMKNSSLTLFNELGGNNSFFKFSSNNLPRDLTFSSLEIKSGLLYEHNITKKTVFSLSAGALNTVTSKIIEKGEKPKDYLIDNKTGLVPFVQVGISVLPFWRPAKK